MKLFLITLLLPLMTYAYQIGDLVFIESQSQQSQAIREATHSKWTHVGMIIDSKDTVISEKGGLIKESFKSFVAGSKGKVFKVMRFNKYNQSMNKKLLAAIPKYNKKYDILFRWADDKLYCSEFTYKIMAEITGTGVGTLEKFKDMDLTGPAVQELIKKRYTEAGIKFNPEEPILTPVSQINDKNLVEVVK